MSWVGRDGEARNLGVPQSPVPRLSQRALNAKNPSTGGKVVVPWMTPNQGVSHKAVR